MTIGELKKYIDDLVEKGLSNFEIEVGADVPDCERYFYTRFDRIEFITFYKEKNVVHVKLKEFDQTWFDDYV